ncbi:Similar to LARP6: La-related protein 6 (Homo sapiens) [Cotesia congregata]|uniref:Similar to LARP6: La-related protein 6 (Homo sapiens) n=1 Tax=Cotesia congregata TaxID=51543 RepID=A0A8J2HBM6_COTCN|nr:Similar to LARP6: La-related protein 6 (Homo sapiens) [Cotesia congregata]
MDDQLDIQQESLDEVGSLCSPAPMRKSDTRDSISSIDSDVSLSFDRRGSKSEEADFSDFGSSIDEPDRVSPVATSSTVNNVAENIKLQPEEICVDNNVEKNIDDSSKEESDGYHSKSGDETTALNPLSSSDQQEDDVPPICSDDLAEKIAAQVEFYFSDENIVKDAFLLKHVKRNKEGYVSLKLISSFKRVKHLSRDWRVVGAALRAKSTKLQVNDLGTKLRRRDPLPQYDQTLPSRTVIAAKLPLEKLTIESVAELFRQFGEIALIRILRPGHPVPAEVRQAISKRPELGTDDECALIEFTDSAAARAAQQLTLGDAVIYELQQISSGEKKRKQQSSQQQNQPQSQPSKKSVAARLSAARENVYSSSCPSGSEEDNRGSKFKSGRVYQSKRDIIPPSPYTCHACAISGTENNSLLMRRLSACSTSGSSSDVSSYSGSRRFSSCSSASDNSFGSPLYHHSPHQSHHNLYPPFNYWPGQPTSRRFSCCTPSNITSQNIGGYGFDYPNGSFYHQTGRRGSAECGTFLRRLSNCSRDSGYDPGSRRLSSCSSGSDSCSGFRSRSNSGFVLMAHLPENVTRLPSGPDGTRGFGRSNSAVETSTSNTVDPSCG